MLILNEEDRNIKVYYADDKGNIKAGLGTLNTDSDYIEIDNSGIKLKLYDYNRFDKVHKAIWNFVRFEKSNERLLIVTKGDITTVKHMIGVEEREKTIYNGKLTVDIDGWYFIIKVFGYDIRFRELEQVVWTVENE